MLDYYDNGNMLFDVADIYLNRCEVKATPVHAHSFAEIAFVAKGEGFHKIGEINYPCNKGQVYFINHDTPHQFISEPDSKFIIYNCVFKLDFLDSCLINSKEFYDVTYGFLMKTLGDDGVLKTPKANLDERGFTTIHAIYEEMLKEYDLKEEGFLEILKADLIRLIVFMLRVMKKEKSYRNELSHNNSFLEKAIEYIHRNYYKDITLEELSMQAFLSQSHFCRLFKEYSGITVKEFTQRIRIDEACRLLKATDDKVADIALQVGYNDMKYFNSLFKRLTNHTPNEYRKKP